MIDHILTILRDGHGDTFTPPKSPLHMGMGTLCTSNKSWAWLHFALPKKPPICGHGRLFERKGGCTSSRTHISDQRLKQGENAFNPLDPFMIIRTFECP